MKNPQGFLNVEARGETFTLHLGFSGIAALQQKHGADFITKMQPPPEAAPGWMPDVGVLCDLILEALQRHHGDVADRWLADDVLAANPEVASEIFEAAFPDQVKARSEAGAQGKPGGRRKAS